MQLLLPVILLLSMPSDPKSSFKAEILSAAVTMGPGMAPSDNESFQYQPSLDAELRLTGSAPQKGPLHLVFSLVKGHGGIHTSPPPKKIKTEQRRDLGPKAEKRLAYEGKEYYERFSLPWPSTLSPEEGWFLEVRISQKDRLIAHITAPIVVLYLQSTQPPALPGKDIQ